MKKNEKKEFPYTLLIIVILSMVTYFFMPKDFWKDMTKNSASNPSPNVGTSKSTPASLRFIDPFKYDNYKPSSRDEFIRKRADDAKDMKKEGKSLFFK